MEKMNTLESRIKKYASVAAGVGAVTGASAQVIYTDVNPDVVLTPGGTVSQYSLDFDGGGVMDIGFVMVAGSQTGIYTYGPYQIPYTVSYQGGVAVFGTAGPATNGWMGSSAPSALSSGQRIGSSGSFSGSQGNVGVIQSTYLGAPISGSYGPYTDGNFAGTEAYIGVRFDNNGSVHYGWARIEVAADGSSMTIKDYAFESTADTPINAGSQASMASVEELDNQIIVNNAFNKVNITMDGINEADIIVVGLDGKQYANQTIGATAQIDLTHLSTGIYLVNVSTVEGTTTRKIYIK